MSRKYIDSVALDKLKENNYTYQFAQPSKIEFFEDDATPLYDIEVEDNHSFVLEKGGGLVVHNSLKQGRDRHTQAVLPLRGKVLNTEKADEGRFVKNKELGNIVSALGASYGKTFDFSKLRYKSVIMACDADIDGNHIRTLLITFFYNYMRPLIENGCLYAAQPPLYKITYKKCILYAYSDKERDEIVNKIKAENKAFTVQRFKGLGELNSSELYDTTVSKATRKALKRITIQDAEAAHKMIELLMGSNIENRRKFIEENALYAKLDV